MKELGYVYQHRPTGDYVNLHKGKYGDIILKLEKKLKPNFLYYNSDLIEKNLIESINEHCDHYAAENFLEFELRKIEVNMKLV